MTEENNKEEAPIPYVDARLIISMETRNNTSHTLTLPFRTIEEAEKIMDLLITNHWSHPCKITHVGGKTIIFDPRSIIAMTIASQTAEDHARLRDIPYFKHIEQEEENVTKRPLKTGFRLQ